MPSNEPAWQKSSYCAQGNSCLHVAAAELGAVQLTESSDPRRAILTAAPSAFGALLAVLKKEDHHG